jgi:ATP-dependent helicase HrpA
MRSRLAGAMLQDRQRISKRLRTIKGRAGKGMPDKRILDQLADLEKRLEASMARKERRFANRPPITYPEQLPIFSKKDEIIDSIKRHQVLIIAGDTGSGKSTQIPKMCLEAGQGIAGKIGCTQPRRIAATTIGRRIAEELGEEIGKSVGYKIRFTDRTKPDAYIKVMTDGILLAETQQDSLLNEYDTLIIDEAHERSLNIDFLLGLLKTLLPKRKDLRLIITSATLDTEKFSAAFNRAHVVAVEGRRYPVEIEYMPVDQELEEAGGVTYVDMAVRAVEDIKRRKGRGDILIFMPTEQDIRETCELLEGRQFSGTMILPLFARLTAAQQKRVFASFSGQKIVVATNVAETSLTIPGIKYVVDTGLARIPQYMPKSRTTSLPISPISRSSADQRMGRCGRLENGICIRLYSEEDYQSRPEFTAPEILRSNLAEVILRMLSLNLGHIASFPFVDRPSVRSVKDGFDILIELGAIVRKGKAASLTEKGRVMSRLPMDPRISRIMIEASREGCVNDVAIIAAALCIQDPRERPLEKAVQADQMHARFKNPDSDFMTLLNIWNQYHRSWGALKTQNKVRKFCTEHFLSFVRMREWRDIYDQITTILKEQDLTTDRIDTGRTPESRYADIHRSILSGYLSNIAVKKDKNIYLAARGREVMVFPGSALFNRGSPWIVAAEMVKTSRLFSRTVARIEAEWIEALGADLCKSSYSDPHWEKNRGEVRAKEKVTLYGLVIVPGRSVSYGPINPEESHRIFVQAALIEGEVKEPFPFLSHNLRLMQRIADMEDKVRRRNILASEQQVADFYSERLPDVSDVATLKKRIKEKGGDEFLKMQEEDLILSRPDETVLGGYPDHMAVGERTYRFAYRFSPGAEEDGVTISIPSSLASRFPAERLEWMVPGLLREKVTALIKALPKRFRKQLVPVSKTVEIIMSEMEQTHPSLIATMAHFIYRRFGVDIPASQWHDIEIPDFLKMRVSITDPSGREVEAGRDIHLLKRHEKIFSSAEKESRAWRDASEKWERSGMTSWDFGPIPEQLSLGADLVAYPALEPADGFVNIRLFTNSETALESHKKGIQTLFSLVLAKEIKFLRRVLKLPGTRMEAAKYFGGPRAIEEAVYKRLMHDLFNLDIRTEAAFLAHAQAVKPTIVLKANVLMDQSGKVLDAFLHTRTVLHSIETANRSNKGVQALCAEIRKDLERLVPGDFIERYSSDRIAHLFRYLKAMEMRAERGANDLEKDRRKAAEAAVFTKTLEKFKEELSAHASQEKRDALDAFAWMVEEFKVSLFAQELKTPHRVSKKRLEQEIKEIERMI